MEDYDIEATTLISTGQEVATYNLDKGSTFQIVRIHQRSVILVRELHRYYQKDYQKDYLRDYQKNIIRQTNSTIIYSTIEKSQLYRLMRKASCNTRETLTGGKLHTSYLKKKTYKNCGEKS